MASLYRKWRSPTFDDLVGQEHVVRTLRNAVRQNRVAHAYLFTGPRGTGKTSTARILAKAINCLQPDDGNPCDRCEMCRAANEGRAMDVIEIDAASNTSVDNVRDLRERVAYAAGEARFKVYIVDEVHRLSGAAFDAFLKTLEEPPPHVVFVFASTEPHKLPETITSRCQRFDFRRISPADTLARLRYVASQEGLRVSEDALGLLSLHAHGSLRDALGLLDQVRSYTEGEIQDSQVRSALGLADATLVADLTACLLDRLVGEGLASFHRFVALGGDSRQLTRQMIEYWRSLLLASSGMPADSLELDPALARALAAHGPRITPQKATVVIQALADQDFAAKFSVPAPLPFELSYVRAALALQAPAEERPAASAPPRQIREREIPQPPPRAAPAEPAAPAPEAPGAPAPSPAEAPRPQPAGNGREASQVETAWPEVVAGMRKKSPSLQALLRSGHIMGVADGVITVGFLHKFHQEQFADTKKRRVLEEVVAEVLGTPYRVNCIRTTKEEVEAVKGAEALQEDDGFVEEVTERLREFHARQLGNGHS
ncbi:MAG: DNA polymerase III subunit gamma/tau [Chloroflexi bacterium]|nr:DNA polymerase III subunit gamma/tau [Chloroflexota bacterium]